MKNEKNPLVCTAAFIFLPIYLWASGSCLLTFPFVHSDESWLAGLSRTMMAAGDLGATEGFFDAKPRVAHAMKSLFHLMQMGMIRIGGFSVGSARLLSLTGAVLCLLLFYRLARTMAGPWFSLGLTVLLSLDIQFLYASHFARQEIWIAGELLFCMGLLIRARGLPGVRQAAALGAVTGLFVGVHPNSFLCGAVCGSVMLFSMAGEWRRDRAAAKRAFVSLLAYVGAAALATAVFVAMSFSFSPGFLRNYFQYGKEEFELSSSYGGRIKELVGFFSGVYEKAPGTYYLPEVRLEMIGMAGAAVLALVVWLVMRRDVKTGTLEGDWVDHTRVILTGGLGLTVGMMVIGRYNPTAVLFFFLFGWLLLGQVLLLFEKQGQRFGILLLMAALFAGSLGQIRAQLPKPGDDYASYLEQLANIVPPDGAVIGNLNMEFYFDEGMLKDYRNLPYVAGEVEEYIKGNGTKYICYSRELDYIYEHRPYYNSVYGDAAFIRELKEFCLSSCEEMGRIYAPGYGARITGLRGNPDYGEVIVYQVRP